jgi:hypothetical protein
MTDGTPSHGRSPLLLANNLTASVRASPIAFPCSQDVEFTALSISAQSFISSKIQKYGLPKVELIRIVSSHLAVMVMFASYALFTIVSTSQRTIPCTHDQHKQDSETESHVLTLFKCSNSVAAN